MRLDEMELNMLITLDSFYTDPIDFRAPTEEMHERYIHGFRTTGVAFEIVSRPNMSHVFDVNIRIQVVYQLLFYAESFCIDHNTYESGIRMSYRLSMFIERHNCMVQQEHESYVYLIRNGMTLCFSFAYCRFLYKYVIKLHLHVSQQSLAEAVKTFGIMKKISIAWNLVHREMHLLYQRRGKVCQIARCRLKTFMPKVVPLLICTMSRIYCILKKEGYGMQRFMKDVNEQISLLPRDQACKDLVLAHEQISAALQRLVDHSWLLMNIILMCRKVGAGQNRPNTAT